MITTILKTKFHIPVPVHVLVERPHLIEQLEIGCKHNLTLVCAPAGSGKSTLLSQWIREKNLEKQTIWLSLDEGDNELERYITYLVAGLRQIDDSIGSVTDSLLQSPQQLSYETLLTPLLNNINSLQTPINLILDDYHLISEPVIHDAMAFLLSHKPPHFHIAIASRHDPPFSLGKIRARRQLTEIRAVDLGFSYDETYDFFQSMVGTTIEPQDIILLNKRTEGWIAGLQLAGLALDGRDDVTDFISRFAGDHTYLVDYLGEEVFNRQSNDIRDFLLKTAILSRLSPELCNAVTGTDQGQDILDQLRRANLFLIPLDDTREWYRYHHLFADLLLHFLQQKHPDQIAELHYRASKWYEQNNFVYDAVHHALTGKHYIHAADLIESTALSIVGQSKLSTVQEWIEAIPESVVHNRPYLSLYLGWAYNFSSRGETIEQYLQSAESALQRSQRDNTQTRDNIVGQVALLRAYGALREDRLSEAIAFLHQSLRLIPDEVAIPRCVSYLAGGDVYRKLGEFSEAQTYLLESISFRKLARMGLQYPTGAAVGLLADVYIQMGQLRKSFDLCEQTIADDFYYHRNKPLAILGYVYGRLGKILYEYNQLDDAVDVLQQSVEMAKWMRGQEMLADCTAMIALVKHRQAHHEEAKALLNRTNQIVKEANLTYLTMLVKERLTKVCLEQETCIEPDSKWVQDGEEQLQFKLPWHEVGALALARIKIYHRQWGEALTLLNEAIQSAEVLGALDWVIKGLVLKAIVCHRKRHHKLSLETLATALSLAEPEGYIRTFVDEGDVMANLLSRLILDYDQYINDFTFSVKYASKLLKLINDELQVKPRLHEQLTDRELEVLRLLSIGLSNQDIADRLFITLGTVKQYNHIIYRKLDVGTRRQAVERAMELHLI